MRLLLIYIIFLTFTISCNKKKSVKNPTPLNIKPSTLIPNLPKKTLDTITNHSDKIGICKQFKLNQNHFLSPSDICSSIKNFDTETLCSIANSKEDMEQMHCDGFTKNKHEIIHIFAYELLLTTLLVNNTEALIILKNKGLNINKLYDSKTLLHYSVENNNLEQVKILLKLNADISKKNKEGKSSFHTAVLFFRQKILLEFIQNGININDLTEEGWSALDILLLEFYSIQREMQQDDIDVKKMNALLNQNNIVEGIIIYLIKNKAELVKFKKLYPEERSISI